MGDDPYLDAAARYERFRELQDAAAGALAAEAAEPAVEITAALAQMLRRFHGDDGLWRRLKDDHEALTHLTPHERRELFAAAGIDWAPFLVEAGYPPPATAVADEFQAAITAVLTKSTSVDLGEVRERVWVLAQQLDGAVDAARRGWIKRSLAVLRASMPAIARTAVVQGAAAGLGTGTAAFAAFAASAGPVGAAAAGAAVRAAAVQVLDAHLPGRPAAADTAYDDARALVASLVMPGPVGVRVSDLQRMDFAVAELGRPVAGAARDTGYDDVLRNMVAWLGHATAAVLLLWEVAERDGRDTVVPLCADAADALAAVTDALWRECGSLDASGAGLRNALTALYAAVHG
ncbi:MAG TPA: hypothetical protein VFQ85_12855 [Mycobacteriales bacterium]|jgi:hypothetical protein|nr:hypothetical protein [Mycobacteriales bacterium]